MVAPCIARTAVPVAYPVPTTVTVVPTAAEDGLMTDTDCETTVYPTVLYVPPTAANANVRTPEGVLCGTVNVAVCGVGHAEGAFSADVTSGAPCKLADAGV